MRQTLAQLRREFVAASRYEAAPRLREFVSEQIGQPQPGCERYDDRNSNERKHPVHVRHIVASSVTSVSTASRQD